MQPTAPLIFVLTDKNETTKPINKNKRKADTVKTENTCDKDKLKVKSDSFGAAINASAVRASRNVSALFHVRPVCM